MDARQPNEPQPQQQRRQQEVMQLTPQEVAVFRDCMREGFYSRCVPISALLATGTYVACQRGIFSKHPKYGALGKVSLALGIGYFLGKISYYQVCYKRLLNVPGGVVARRYREMKENLGQGGAMEQPGFFSNDLFSSSPSAPVDSEAAPSLSLDFDAATLTDTDFPRSFSDFKFEDDKFKEPATFIPPSTTYEELRTQNRSQYERERNLPTSKPPGGPPDRPASQPIWETDNRPQRPKKKNIYGDEFDP